MTEHDILEYGAVGNGETMETEAIQSAIDACAIDGGTVVVPSGEYLTAPLFLRSNVEFHLEAGARLEATDDISAYPAVDGRWEGVDQETYASILTGRDLENVSITGRGTVDGAGRVWWVAHVHDEQIFKQHGLGREEQYPPPEGTTLDYPRPRTIDLYNCEDVLIRDVTIKNSPAWTIHPIYCSNVTVDNVTIKNPEYSSNTDGINPDSCQNVRISNCYINVGDDCITIKSGYNEGGRRIGIPCENIVITNCTMEHGHGGVVIGSEMSGDVRNVTISNCTFDGTDNGLRIKTERGRGGVVENVRATNIVMHDIRLTAFIVTMFYHGAPDNSEPITEETPEVRNVRYSDINVDNVKTVASLRGLSEMPIEAFELTNVWATDATRGIEATNVNDMTLENVRIDAANSPAFNIEQVTDLELDQISDLNRDLSEPVVRLSDVDAVVRSCTAPDDSPFLEYGDDDTVHTSGNLLDRTEQRLSLDE